MGSYVSVGELWIPRGKRGKFERVASETAALRVGSILNERLQFDYVVAVDRFRIFECYAHYTVL